MAPGRVLGAGAAAVRHRLRAPMTGDDRAAEPAGGPALEIVAGVAIGTTHFPFFIVHICWNARILS